MTEMRKLIYIAVMSTSLFLPALAAMIPHAAGAAPNIVSPRRDIIAGPIRGEVVDILDGDTVSVRLHVWIGQVVETHVRIDGIDTPEMKGKCTAERDKALSARNEIEKLINKRQIILSNIRLEKYAGRVLATATTASGVNIAEHMIEKGLARAYAGAKRQGWCDLSAK